MRCAAACTALVFAGAFVAVPGSKADPGEQDPATSAAGSDYAAGKKAVEAKDWQTGIRLLSSAALRDTRNAEIQNLLGYAYRNTGELSYAFKHYSRALQLNPRHRGAHEYVGEAYLMIGNLPKAQEHLAELKKICLIPCEEYEDLKKTLLAACPDQRQTWLAGLLENANAPPLRKRIEDVVAKAGEIVQPFIETFSNFAGRLTRYRHQYAHLLPSKPVETAAYHELVDLYDAARIVLEACLMLDLGFTPKHVQASLSEKRDYAQLIRRPHVTLSSETS